MQTYPEMNEKIKALLADPDNPVHAYALARIIELETALESACEHIGENNDPA